MYKNIISFSIWGNNPLYWQGAVQNAKLVPEIYGDDWGCKFYYDNQVPQKCIDRLIALDAEVECMGGVDTSWEGGFWKHRAALMDGVERIIVRDADSRLSLREKMAVSQWVASGKSFHIMRDHPYHSVPILGGTWGATKDVALKIVALFQGWQYDWTDKQVDQVFLQQKVWPIIANQCFIHDEISPMRNIQCLPFPTKRNGLEFIGEIFDENNQPNLEHRAILRKVIT
jgi:hypothetical protein